MKHQIDIIALLAEDGDLICYRRSLVPVAGSITAAILLSRILFWWRKQNRKPFYKFKAPPAKLHEKYKEEDSWTEELAFSIYEFDGALKKIGRKIGKGGKLDVEAIVWFWTDAHNVTWWRVNEARLLFLMEMEISHLANSDLDKETGNPGLYKEEENSDFDKNPSGSSSHSNHDDSQLGGGEDEIIWPASLANHMTSIEPMLAKIVAGDQQAFVDELGQKLSENKITGSPTAYASGMLKRGWQPGASVMQKRQIDDIDNQVQEIIAAAQGGATVMLDGHQVAVNDRYLVKPNGEHHPLSPLLLKGRVTVVS